MIESCNGNDPIKTAPTAHADTNAMKNTCALVSADALDLISCTDLYSSSLGVPVVFGGFGTIKRTLDLSSSLTSSFIFPHPTPYI
jgi:hypothetical protein